jgi:hypothetical protein
MDFKSSREAYFSQFVQVAGYDIEISENGIFDADGNRIKKVEDIGEISFYAVFPFGMENPAPQFSFDTQGMRKGFEAATVPCNAGNVTIDVRRKACSAFFQIDRHAGVDRVDSAQEYWLSNVVPCCANCNRAKSDRPQNEFIDRCKRVASRFH